MYIDAIKSGESIVSWIRDEDGQLHTIQESAPYYCFSPSPVGEYESIYGDPLRKVDFQGYQDFKGHKDSQENLFESDISPLYKYLSDEYYGVEGGPVRVGLFDIEVHPHLEREKGYPTHDDPHGEINSVSLFNRYEQKYHLFLLVPDMPNVNVEAKDGLPVEHYHCNSEMELIRRFLTMIENIDVLSAWSGDQFDIPYVISRVTRIMGSETVKKLCRGGFKPKAMEKEDDYGNEIIEYQLIGRVHLDALKLFKKFTFEKKQSYKLDNVAEEELDENKLEFAGDLGKLYEQDPQKFFDYSLHDTYLLKELDAKHRHIDLAVTMARRATVRFTDVLTSIKYLEHAIMNYAHFERKNPVVLPDKPQQAVKESFPGAYVLKTKTGVYSWVVSVDLSQLYPNTIRSLNISPETKVMQCKDEHNDFLRVVQQRDTPVEVVLNCSNGSKEHFSVSASELHHIIREEGYTISANATIFRTDHEGLIPEVLRGWVASRGEDKAKAKELSTEIARIKDSSEMDNQEKEDTISQLEEQKLSLENSSAIKKLNANSVYGAISNPHCRFFDLEIARSITMTGQEIGRFQIYRVDSMVEEKHNGNS